MSAPDWTTYVIAYMHRCVIGFLHAYYAFISTTLGKISVDFWIVIVEPSCSTWNFVIRCTLWTLKYDVLACDRSGIFPLYIININKNSDFCLLFL